MTRIGVTADDLASLFDATPPEEIRKRQGPRQHDGMCPKFGTCPQAHLMLDYVDARYVMDRLDRLGPANWQDAYVDRDGGSVRAGIGILFDGEWVWKWDVGTPSDMESEKGSYSDAFKRAAVKWGIGRDLYGHKATKSAPAKPPVAATAPRPAPRDVPATDEPPTPTFTGFSHDEIVDLAGKMDGILPTDWHETGMCPLHNIQMKKNAKGWWHSHNGGFCHGDGR